MLHIVRAKRKALFQPPIFHFLPERDTDSDSFVLHSPTLQPIRLLFVRLPTRLSISCAFFPPKILTNKRKERGREGEREGRVTDRKKGKFRPRHLLQSRVPHIALCSRIASDRRPTASFSSEVTLGAKTDRFSSRSQTQSQSSLLSAKFRSYLPLSSSGSFLPVRGRYICSPS